MNIDSFIVHVKTDDIYKDIAEEVCKDFKIKHENIMICMFKVIHYCYLMYLKTFEICTLKYMDLTMLGFLLHQH